MADSLQPHGLPNCSMLGFPVLHYLRRALIFVSDRLDFSTNPVCPWATHLISLSLFSRTRTCTLQKLELRLQKIYARHLTQSGTEEVQQSPRRFSCILVLLSFQAHSRTVQHFPAPHEVDLGLFMTCTGQQNLKSQWIFTSFTHSLPTTMVSIEASQMKPLSSWVTVWPWWAEIPYRRK